MRTGCTTSSGASCAGRRGCWATTPRWWSSTRRSLWTRIQSPRPRSSGGGFDCLDVPDAGVEPGVGDVDGEVGQDEGQGEYEDETLHDHEVAEQDRLQGVLAHAVKVEHRLDDYLTPHHPADLKTYHRHHRDEGVPKGVPHDHPPLPQPLGPGGAYVVVPHHLQQG